MVVTFIKLLKHSQNVAIRDPAAPNPPGTSSGLLDPDSLQIRVVSRRAVEAQRWRDEEKSQRRGAKEARKRAKRLRKEEARARRRHADKAEGHGSRNNPVAAASVVMRSPTLILGDNHSNGAPS